MLIVAAAVGTAEVRGWRAWDEWHCMVTFYRASLHSYSPGFILTLLIISGIIFLSLKSHNLKLPVKFRNVFKYSYQETVHHNVDSQ